MMCVEIAESLNSPYLPIASIL